MIRWLLIALFIYLLYKLIKGPKSKNSRTRRGSKKRKNFDQIEEAEFEDITNKEKKANQP